MRALPLLLVAACGDNLTVRDPDTAYSGSRLRLIHHVYDDDTRQLETTRLFDRDRDEECAPQTWSDGARYCTPPSLPAVFTDSACSMLAGTVITATPPIVPAYFRREYILRGDPLPSRLYEPSERIAAPALIWELLDGQCIGPSTADPFHDYFALGPEITSDAFARVARTEIATTARLVPAQYTSSDGMQLPIPDRLRDTTLDVDCTLAAKPGDDRATCVPTVVAANYFVDFACTEPALAVRTSAERPAFAVYTDRATGCPRYARTGDEVGVPPLFRHTATGCIAAVPPSDDRFYVMGAPLDLATVSRDHALEPDHRLARIELIDGERHAGDLRLFDTQLGIECERTSTPEGDRCLPTSSLTPEREPIYRDDLCTSALALVLVPSPFCTPPTHVVTANASGVEVRALSPYAGAIYHLSTGDRCLPYTVAGADRPHELGPAIPLATFVGATTIID